MYVRLSLICFIFLSCLIVHLNAGEIKVTCSDLSSMKHLCNGDDNEAYAICGELYDYDQNETGCNDVSFKVEGDDDLVTRTDVVCGMENGQLYAVTGGGGSHKYLIWADEGDVFYPSHWSD